MLILVSENPVGYEVVEYKGVVFGSGKTMENKDASEVAIDVMTKMATKIGANAVINVNIRCSSSLLLLILCAKSVIQKKKRRPINVRNK